MRLRKEELLAGLPPEWPHDLLPRISAQVLAASQTIVVLDDDPTGTQTVYHVPVLTEWSTASLTEALVEPGGLFFILTNSRSLPLVEAQALNRGIAQNLTVASQAAGRAFVVVSRSDSTLRGHFPGEIEALSSALGGKFDGTLIVPFFAEGGRLTIEDVHYVVEGDWLVPAAETEYARDAAFGYRNSDLRAWVTEKTGGRVQPEEVMSLSLEMVRRQGPDAVAACLQEIKNGQVCLVNAASYRDLEVGVAGVLEAEAAGKRFIYRTAASFVRVRAGLPAHPLLSSAELFEGKSSPERLGTPAEPASTGGLVVVGSYIQKSSDQIALLQTLPGISSLEVSVPQLLDPATNRMEIARAAADVNKALSSGSDALLYTSRKLRAPSSGETALQTGRIVSEALVEIVKRLTICPAWIIAKGGITSSDIATDALNVKRALVLGQAIAGVPVWRIGAGSRWPDLTYVVFPGNVGQADSLAEMVRLLRAGL